MPTLHMIYNGETYDYEQNDLDVGPESSKNEVLDALANAAGIPRVKLSAMNVNVNQETGDLTVSPSAIFGDITLQDYIKTLPKDEQEEIARLKEELLKQI